MKRSASLKHILLRNFAVVALFPFLAIGFVVLQGLTSSMKRDISEKNLLLAHSFRGGLEKFFEEPLNVLRYIETMLENPGLLPLEHMTSFLELTLKDYPFIESILLLNH